MTSSSSSIERRQEETKCPNCKSIKVIYYLDGDKQECYICHTCNYTAAKKEFIK